jgi:beta-lactamase class A
MILSIFFLGYFIINEINRNVPIIYPIEEAWNVELKNAEGINIKNPEDINLLKIELENYIKRFKGHYGIYYYDLTNSESFGINHKEGYDAASTTKLPLNLYLYEKILEGKVNPQSYLTYLKQDYAYGTGIIQSQKFGKKYTIKELSRLSIVYSDNIASNMLFRYLGRSNVKNYMQSIGGTYIDEDQNVTSPDDLGIYLIRLYEFHKENDYLGNELMSSFLNTKFNDRIPALLPKSVKVAHKIGNQTQVVNDAAIVFAKQPYILVVMSRDVNETEASKVIANISKKIFDFIS